jgi:cell division protein ZapA
MEEIRGGSQIIGLERIAVMAALNLAHDLIQTEQSAEQNSFASDVLQTMNSKIDSALFELTS